MSRGSRFISPAVADQLLWDTEIADQPHEKLSRREKQVFQLLGEGRGVTEIGEILGISFKTVSTYRSQDPGQDADVEQRRVDLILHAASGRRANGDEELGAKGQRGKGAKGQRVEQAAVEWRARQASGAVSIVLQRLGGVSIQRAQNARHSTAACRPFSPLRPFAPLPLCPCFSTLPLSCPSRLAVFAEIDGAADRLGGSLASETELQFRGFGRLNAPKLDLVALYPAVNLAP